MTLDEILGNLTVEKDGKREINDKYIPELIVSAGDSLSELEKADIETGEGLAVYEKITGDNSAQYSPEELNFKKGIRLKGGREDLGGYVNRHFDNLIDELEEPIQVNLAYTYCPTKDITSDEATEFNQARKIISDAREKLQKIKENPEAYLTEEIKNESPLMARYLSRYAKEFLEFEESEAQRKAVLSIQGYNAAKFLKDVKKQSDTQPGKLHEKKSAIEKDMKTKIEKVMRKNEGKPITPRERAELLSDEYVKMKKLSEEHSDMEMYSKFTQDVASYAINTIKEKIKKANSPENEGLIKQENSESDSEQAD